MTENQKIARGHRTQSKGRKRPFTQEQVQLIRMSLSARSEVMQLALLEMAISTCLRAGDLLALKVSDILGSGHGGGPIASVFPLKQQKTSRVMSVRLSRRAQDCIYAWIGRANLGPNDRLFKFTRQHYGRLVKDWARAAHLDAKHYSTHSMRRTQPSHLYKRTNNVMAAAELLGHANPTHTGAYLGMTTETAHALTEENEV